MFDDDNRRPSPADMPSPRPEPPMSAAEFDRIQRRGARLHYELERAVRRMLLRGCNFADVGRALGVSRQAARKRWGYLVDQEVAVAIVRGSDGKAFFFSEDLNERLDLSKQGRVIAGQIVRSLGPGQ